MDLAYARRRWAIVAVVALVAAAMGLPASPGQAASFAFEPPDDLGITVSNPTSIDWGPDNRLYVGQMNGTIRVFEVTRNGAGDFSASEVADRATTQVKNIPNHNDNGSSYSSPNRLMTGIIVEGTAANPVIYATSSDPRINTDLENVDTNSGVVSKLRWNGNGYDHQKLVQGLPRSRENHGPNGLHLDTATNTLYVAHGGNTNMGGPSSAFVNLPEFALSAAILEIDLDAIGTGTCNLQTIQAGTSNCLNNPDPWGGAGGANMAKKLTSGPVQVYAPGFRNPYDIIITEAGRMYTIDNGANAAFGNPPVGVNTPNCTNEIVGNPGATHPDHLEMITAKGYYGGHPNPTRGNPASSGFSQAVPGGANSIECNLEHPLSDSSVLTADFDFSTNSITEYTASTFGGGMKGDLITVEFSYQTGADAKLLRIDLNNSGTVGPDGVQSLGQPGGGPLGVVALGDADKFPGVIFVANWISNNVVAFEPNTSLADCTGVYDEYLDEDFDGYSNADEIDNGTNPCNPADTPPDWDGDGISDLNDPDDDNDGIPDELDRFALDPNNGNGTTVPVDYQWENDAPNAGGLLGLGFTGLMINGTDNYRDLFDPARMTVIGAAGVVTVDEATGGDAYGSINNQDYGFQFGVEVPAQRFSAHTRLMSPFSGSTPEEGQSFGLFVGAGTQDDYMKIVAVADGIEVVREIGGQPQRVGSASVSLPGPDYIDVWLTVDPGARTARASYSVEGGTREAAGPAVALPAGWFSRPIAVGIISTSRGASTFPATWDFIRVVADAWSGPPPTSPPGGQDGSFDDIEGSIFQAEIEWLAAAGITKGCNPPDNTLFCPTAEVTRGQMAAFLHRALGGLLEVGEPVAFADDNNSVFETDIEWLGASGVTKGCNPPANSRFCPSDAVTRGQMAAFLHRALGGVLPTGSTIDFVDDNTSVFESDIEWLAATAVTRGCNPPTNDRFCPNEPVTREQMAAFLYRALR